MSGPSSFSSSFDTELIKYVGERIIETLARIGNAENAEKTLTEMNVFLTREAAFGQNCK